MNDNSTTLYYCLSKLKYIPTLVSSRDEHVVVVVDKSVTLPRRVRRAIASLEV